MCVFNINMETLVQAVLGDITLGKLWVAQLKLTRMWNFSFLFGLFLNKTTEYIWVTLVCSSSSCMNFQGVSVKIWMRVLEIMFSSICMTVLLSFTLLSSHYYLALWMHSVPSKPHLPQNPSPLHSFSHTHTHWFTAFTLIGIDIRTVPPHVKASHWWWTAGPSLARWSRQFHLLLFFFFCVDVVGGWDPLVKWIKIPNNSNNNDNKKLIKNGMFLPDCASVVVFNYAIFIGILIIFSTNKPPLIKAKHG